MFRSPVVTSRNHRPSPASVLERLLQLTLSSLRVSVAIVTCSPQGFLEVEAHAGDDDVIAMLLPFLPGLEDFQDPETGLICLEEPALLKSVLPSALPLTCIAAAPIETPAQLRHWGYLWVADQAPRPQIEVDRVILAELAAVMAEVMSTPIPPIASYRSDAWQPSDRDPEVQCRQRQETERGGPGLKPICSSQVGDGGDEETQPGLAPIPRTYLSSLTSRFTEVGRHSPAGAGSEKTSHQQIEQALYQADVYVHQLFELAPHGIAIIGLTGRLLRVNGAFCELLGCDSRSLHEMAIRDLCPSEDARRIQDHIDHMLQGHPPVPPLKHRLFHQSTGEIITVICRLTMVRDDRGYSLHVLSQILGQETRLETSSPLEAILNFVSGPVASEDNSSARVVSDDTEQARIRQALRDSTFGFRAAFAQTVLGLYVADRQGRCLTANPALQALLGYKEADLKGRRLMEVSDPQEDATHLQFHHDLIQGDRSHYQVEQCYIHAEGRPIWCRLTVSAVRDPLGDLQFIIGVVEDITEQKHSDQQVQSALQEKEMLLREIHHRVKNNLQILSSLLRLQAESIKSRKYSRIFQDAWSRVQSMALVHEELYQAQDLSKMSLVDYIQGLVSKLFHAYGVDTHRIRFELDIEQVVLSIDTGVTCSLILNELLTNALKYAFPDSRQGCLWVSLHQDETWTRLQVRDDGIGIPAGFDLAETNSLGLQLVSTLTEQLEGTIELNRIAGTTFTIVFPRSKS